MNVRKVGAQRLTAPSRGVESRAVVGPSMKDGDIELRDVLVPTEPMKPGATFEIRVVALNHANVIFDDPDGCANEGTPCSGKDGYCIGVRVHTNATTLAENQCLNLDFFGIPPNQEVYTYRATVPESVSGSAETQNVSAELLSTTSETGTGQLVAEIQVDPNAPEPSSGVYGAPRPQNYDGGDAFMRKGASYIFLFLLAVVIIKEIIPE